jgi:hypothetical protein
MIATAGEVHAAKITNINKPNNPISELYLCVCMCVWSIILSRMAFLPVIREANLDCP